MQTNKFYMINTPARVYFQKKNANKKTRRTNLAFSRKICQHSYNTVPKHERGSYFLIIEVNERPSNPSLVNKTNIEAICMEKFLLIVLKRCTSLVLPPYQIIG
jgi:hypothetical protein